MPKQDVEAIRLAILSVHDETDWVEDFEYQTRLGIDRSDVKKVLDEYPFVDDNDKIFALAINSSLGELLEWGAGHST